LQQLFTYLSDFDSFYIIKLQIFPFLFSVVFIVYYLLGIMMHVSLPVVLLEAPFYGILPYGSYLLSLLSHGDFW